MEEFQVQNGGRIFDSKSKFHEAHDGIEEKIQNAIHSISTYQNINWIVW